jgi:hypothetical protein
MSVIRTRVYRGALGLLVALGLGLALSAPAAAQAELPTGAARLVEKVQLRIFFAKGSLLNEVADIQAKAEETAAGLAE